MMPTLIEEQAPVPPPSFQRRQARLSRALHIDALTLVTMLHLLTLCRLAVRLAHRRCPSPLPLSLPTSFGTLLRAMVTSQVVLKRPLIISALAILSAGGSKNLWVMISPCQQAKEEDHAATAKRACCSSVSCEPYGAYRIRTCMIGSQVGLL